MLINDIGNGTKKTSNGIESEKSVDLCDKENKCWSMTLNKEAMIEKVKKAEA